MKVRYPWDEVERGQGFFVPALDTARTREEGLRAALMLKLMDARATPGIRNELIGVWFYRLPPAPVKST